MKSTVFSVLLLVLSLGIVAAADKDPDKKQSTSLSKGTALNPLYGNINIGTIGTWHRADGWANHSPGGADGTTFPSGRVNVIYQDGIIWGGKMFTNAGLTTTPPSQSIRVGGTGTYSISTRAGNVTGQGATAVRANETNFRAWRIRRDFIEVSDAVLATDAAGVNEKSVDRVTAAEVAEVRAQYVKDWAEWPVQYGAPYVDRDGSGTWNPVAGWENMGGDELAALGSDEPGIAGADPNSPADQVTWMVFNDLDTDQSKVNYGSLPLGLEVQKTVWGYKRTDALGKAYFAKYKIINKGGVLVDATNKGAFWIDSMYVAQWSDPDLGDAGNDVSGTDTTLSLGFTYNGAGTDANFAKFGLPHAAVGYDFLQGPIVPGVAGDTAIFDLKYRAGFVNLPMTSFSYFAAGGDFSDPPRGSAQYNGGTGQWWQLLRGFAPTATLVGDPDKNFPTPPGFNPKYIFPSDPESQQGTGWIDGGIGAYTGTDSEGLKYSPTPGDRRIILASGPFLMAPGDTQEIVVGTLAAFGANRFSSVTALKGVDQSVQSTYDLLFQVTRAPAAPNVTVAELDGQVILEWGSDLDRVYRTENEINQPGNYAFEGYNVYQFPTLSSQISDAQRLATYDLVNGILTVFDRQFVPEYGTETDIAIQFGKDVGVQHTYVFDADAVNGIDRLYNGSPYYVGVTAYSVTPITVGYTKALESSPAILTVRPQRAYGTTITSSFGDVVPYTKLSGSSDGYPIATVIDPMKVTGATYTVTVDTSTASYKNTGNADTLIVARPGKTQKLAMATDDTAPIYEGLQWKAVNAPLDFKAFLHVAGPSGAINPPTAASFAFNSSGFPTPDGGPIVAGVNDRPLNDWGGGQWGVHYRVANTGNQSYTAFVANTTQYSGGLGESNQGMQALVPNDYEIRFTATGSIGLSAFATATNGQFINLPFEVWNTGQTPNNTSDDRQIFCLILDDNVNAQFDIVPIDHGISGGTDDPRTDGIYMVEPLDGNAGNNYAAILALAQADPAAFIAGTRWAYLYGPPYGDPMPHTKPALHRLVLVNFNAGSVTDGTFPANLTSAMPATGNVIRIATTKPLNDQDAYTVNTAAFAPVVGSSTAVNASLANVNVFPNPYYGVNPLETNRFQRFVTFNNLPPKAKVRIFNLAGQLVRVLDKDDNSQYLQWNLLNFYNVPVASGFYIVHLDFPEQGQSKVLKLSVIQEQEVFDSY